MRLDHLARGNRDFVVFGKHCAAGNVFEGNQRPRKAAQRALDGQGHVDDDFLLFCILLAAYRNQVGATNPANPTRDVQEEDARNKEFASVGQIAIHH